MRRSGSSVVYLIVTAGHLPADQGDRDTLDHVELVEEVLELKVVSPLFNFPGHG